MTYQMGQKLGNYRLVKLLGSGGFAEVYLGKHIYLQTQAAIKVLQIQLTAEALQNFLREARIIANMEHPNIIRVLEFGIENHKPFLVMNYAPNGTLRQRYPRGRQLAPATVLALLKQIVAALDYAHARKIIHRDIKPENMLLGATSTVLLSDFGLALEGHSAYYSQPADKAGTMLYMAPEQFRGNPCSASDQYSLGVVVYEWLSGALPFEGNALAVAVKHAQLIPTPLHERVPALPIALSTIVMRTLQKEPQERFAHIQEFAEAFEEACQMHAALFSSLEATQLQPEAVIEAQAIQISADTIARISLAGEESRQDLGRTLPFNSQSNFSQGDVFQMGSEMRSLLEEEEKALQSDQETERREKTGERTQPASLEIQTQHVDSDVEAQLISSAVRKKRQKGRRIQLCILGVLSIALGVGGFWVIGGHSRPEVTARVRLQQGNSETATPGLAGRNRMGRTNTKGEIPNDPFQATGTPEPQQSTSTLQNIKIETATPSIVVPQGSSNPSTTPSPVVLQPTTPIDIRNYSATPSPTSSPTPRPIATPSPTMIPIQSNGPLSVYIKNVPTVVQNNSTIAVQVSSSSGGCHVRLQVIYNIASQVFESQLYRTNSNGNAMIRWDVSVDTHGLIKYTIATLIVTADDSSGETAVSLPVIVQVE